MKPFHEPLVNMKNWVKKEMGIKREVNKEKVENVVANSVQQNLVARRIQNEIANSKSRGQIS